MPAISIIAVTRSTKTPAMPHNRPISFLCAYYLLAQKTRPGPVCDRNALPPRIAFIVNASQRFATASIALHHVLPQQPLNQGQGIHEYQPKRGNMLKLNNFCMVNVMELVSKSQKSQKSHKYQRYLGFKFSLFTLMVWFDLHSLGSCSH